MLNFKKNTIAVKNFADIRNRLNQLKAAKEENLKTIFIKRDLPVNRMTFAEYIKQHAKSSNSNTTEE